MHADAPRFLRRSWLKPLRNPLQRAVPEVEPVPAEAPPSAPPPLSLEALEQMLDAAPPRGPAVHEETVPAILWRGEQSAAEAAVDAPELPPPSACATTSRKATD